MEHKNIHECNKREQQKEAEQANSFYCALSA